MSTIQDIPAKSVDQVVGLPSPALSEGLPSGSLEFQPPARTSSMNLPIPSGQHNRSSSNGSFVASPVAQSPLGQSPMASPSSIQSSPIMTMSSSMPNPSLMQPGNATVQPSTVTVQSVQPISAQPLLAQSVISPQPVAATVNPQLATAMAVKPPAAPNAAKALTTSSSSLLQKIFHLHDDDDHSQKKSPGSGIKSETGELKKKDSLMDRLFHRDRPQSASPAGASSPDLRGQTPPPQDLSIQTAGLQSQPSLLIPPLQSGSVSPGTTDPSLAGFSLMREPYAASPAPDSAKNRASPSTPATSSGLQRAPSQSSTTSMKRAASETIISTKYGEMETKVIGRGATSVVRLAHKKDDTNGPKGGPEKLFAVKEFRKRRKEESERDYIKKLTSEFCIGSSLHHPNIVDHLDLLQTPQGGWCEIMEYCAGGDLCTLIQNGGLTYDEANGFFAQLVNGVAYLHSLGVSHKDLKPENLMLDGNGLLKITDFGSAEVFRTVWEKEAHKSRRLAGSEPYIAPEEFTDKEFDPRAVDVWACGIIYLTMIYNRIPWRCATPSDPNYKFYLRCRQKHSHSSSQSLSGTNLSPATAGNLTRSGSQGGLSRSASTSKAGEATTFPMLDHLPAAPRQLIFRMLDPLPGSRITIDEIRKDPWFRNIVRVHHGEDWMDRSESETEKALQKKSGQPHGPSKLNPNPVSPNPVSPIPGQHRPVQSTTSPLLNSIPSNPVGPSPEPSSDSLLNSTSTTSIPINNSSPSLLTPPSSLNATPQASTDDLQKSIENLIVNQ